MKIMREIDKKREKNNIQRLNVMNLKVNKKKSDKQKNILNETRLTIKKKKR